MLAFSPDRSENPLLPGFGNKDCNGERDFAHKKAL